MSSSKRFTAIKIIILGIFLIYTSNVFCQNSQNSISKLPYESITTNLKNKNIVMLADFEHHSMLPKLSLIQAVNEWIKNSTEKDHLTIILEQSDNLVASTYKYIDQDSIEELISNYGEENTIEDLYLISTLKRIINKNPDKIKIKGFENDFTDEIKFTRTEREKDLWFVNQRDSILAERIENYINGNPSEQILIFYGAAHLIDKYISKKPATVSLSEDESYGYFLSHYLKDCFGKKKVITYNQIYLSSEYYNDKEIKNYASDIFMINANSPLLKQLNVDCYDWIIVRNEAYKMPTPIRYIFSMSNLERFYKILSQNEKWNKTYNKNIVKGYILESIRLITGRFFQSLSDYESWITTNRIGLDKLATQSFSDDIFNVLNNNPKSYDVRKMIFALGSGPRFMDTEYLPTKEEWNKEIWQVLSNMIKHLNAVGIMWIGSDKEKELAKKCLLNLTQQDYIEPEKYLEFFYSRFYNYKF